MEKYMTDIENEILDQYVNDKGSRPWIIAFSGGKDSTTLLQLVWGALGKIEPDERTRQIHIVCNNTLVENPTVLEYVKKRLELIKAAAAEQLMPITVEHTIPSLNNTFWVNMIGRGYPAPNSKFRWCTERLKITPTTKYIQNEISRYGEVIILLGTRKAESGTRAKSMQRYEIKGSRLSKHILPGAYVYPPIKNLSTEQVWWYLAENQSPWHSDNADLVHLYRNASDNNDCPLITDTSTPACGGSRFGCWVCTVVRNDKCMQGLIQSGETWMTPLLEIRDFLAKTIDRKDPDYKPEKYRMPVRRNFQQGLGPYWPRFRKEILERLLDTQATIQEQRPDIQLITYQELVAIQLLWHREFIYEGDVSKILKNAYGSEATLPLPVDSTQNERLMLSEVCGSEQGHFELINSLLKAHRNRILFVNQRGLQRDIESILDQHLKPIFNDVYKKDSNQQL